MLPEALAGLSSSYLEAALANGPLERRPQERTGCRALRKSPAPSAAGVGHPDFISKNRYQIYRNREGREELRGLQGDFYPLPYPSVIMILRLLSTPLFFSSDDSMMRQEALGRIRCVLS